MRGLSRIVSEEWSGLIRQRTYNCNPLDCRFQRKQAVVLQQDHRLIRQPAWLGPMFGTVELLFVDLGVRNHVRRIEHAELDARGEQADERSVKIAFRQIALLNGIDIGLVDGFTETRGE